MISNVLQGAYVGELPCKIRGTRKGLLIQFEDCMTASPQAVCATVTEHVQRLSDLFSNDGCVELSGVVLGEIERIGLEMRLGALCKGQVSVKVSDVSEPPVAQKTSKLYTGIVRGGACLFATGDLTVIGDVHAGALLKAGGSITILGKLSGTAHAGVYGDTTAFVAAWQFVKADVRIADVCKELSHGQNAARNVPEIAHLCDGQIEMMQYNAKI